MEGVCEIDQPTLNDLLGKIVSSLEEWLIIGDAYGKIIYANEMVYKMCSQNDIDILGKDMCMFVGMDLSDDEVLEKVQKTIRQGERIEFISSRIVVDNRRIYLMNTVSPIYGLNDVMYYTCISKDITSTTKLQEEIYHINYFDKLTHLPNEKIFLESLGRAIKWAQKKEETFTVTLLDIKKMGQINNLYGVRVRDYIIKEISNRIKTQLNCNQEIFRYSDSVFAIIHKAMSKEVVVRNFLDKMQYIMEEPIVVHGIYISASYRGGCVTYPENGAISEEIIEMAQIALAKAKKEKRHKPYIFYSNAIREEAVSTLQVELEMLEAVENDEFIVYYQPFIELGSEGIVGMEALLRRRKKSGELMGPGTFISTLERMNLIDKVSMRVLEIVCEQIRYWIDHGYKVVPVSVNLSAVQFKNINLAQQIKQVLEHYEVPPKYIVLEITESAVMEDVRSAQIIIDELKEYGFAIAIDDFGTGYASIGYLKKFMFDHLKIDISFIREIGKNMQDRSLVEAIISIAKTLNLKTIAEGIENEEQLYIMSALGCEMGQGFFWGHPVSGTEIEDKYFKIC